MEAVITFKEWKQVLIYEGNRLNEEYVGFLSASTGDCGNFLLLKCMFEICIWLFEPFILQIW
ncbi:hypothetical protein CN345_09285 [Bacillus thuringiensis]|nr:hypothetical protein CN488_29560 [Bacillus anthracis]PEZ39110.1 hypothetical protein CN345_09285 [Bacillus thuringiensis]PGY63490.1 hypothetical protein COE09_01225 [Bacillus thuringiensis]